MVAVVAEDALETKWQREQGAQEAKGDSRGPQGQRGRERGSMCAVVECVAGEREQELSGKVPVGSDGGGSGRYGRYVVGR